MNLSPKCESHPVSLPTVLSFISSVQNRFHPIGWHYAGASAPSATALSIAVANWAQISGYPGSFLLAATVVASSLVGAASMAALHISRDFTLRQAMLHAAKHLQNNNFVPDIVVTLNSGALHCSGILVNRLNADSQHGVSHYSLNADWAEGAFDVVPGEIDNISAFAEKIREKRGIPKVKVLVFVSEVISGSSIHRLRKMLVRSHIELKVFSIILHPTATEPIDWFIKVSEFRCWLTWERSPKEFRRPPPGRGGPRPRPRPTRPRTPTGGGASSESNRIIPFPGIPKKNTRKSA